MWAVDVTREAVGDDDGEMAGEGVGKVAGGWSSGVVRAFVYNGLGIVYGIDIHPVVSA